MKYLVAPWREEYVKKVAHQTGCIFCLALEANNDEQAFILYRGKHNFVILNKYPYNPGHLMIAPYVHTALFEEAPKNSTDELNDLLKLSLKILNNVYHPHGFNTGMNFGQSAGAGVVDHYHLHVVPRWTGDANFMPLIGQTKVVIEDLRKTYQQLRPYFQEITPDP
ncbi:MAG: HIT family hydrolase [Candidatus Aminicenantes bacterium 4484_214]|nr:MAG: HIT family hydrolase [Candidatus Aminicenantes bacterium 4484_214]RLE05626.1 MAG: HIT family hydrolase [Candidatus Aminicenantes bacterium]HDJ23952.1 HIT domain-containing protein [Candidatus Aminicenantes bacterium]